MHVHICRILEITKIDTVRLAATRIGHKDIPLAQVVAYDQFKPVKFGVLHKPSGNIVTDSSTDTDPELPLNEAAYEREHGIVSPVEIAERKNRKQDLGNTGHPDGEENLILIGTKAKVEREAVCRWNYEMLFQSHL